MDNRPITACNVAVGGNININMGDTAKLLVILEDLKFPVQENSKIRTNRILVGLHLFLGCERTRVVQYSP